MCQGEEELEIKKRPHFYFALSNFIPSLTTASYYEQKTIACYKNIAIISFQP